VALTFVMVNSTTYGGSGGAAAVFTLAAGAAEIGLHEMGHTAFHLADEYATPSPTEGGNSYAGPAPLEPNVTNANTAATSPWSALLTPGVAIPTMSNPDCSTIDSRPSTVAAGTVGAFEGARYFHCGIYRPEYDCRMRTLGQPFCHVCSGAISAVLTPHLPAGPTVTAVNPSSGNSAGGDNITITGTGFTGATAVNFGSVAATGVTVVSDAQITCTSPPANVSGSVDVTVTTPNGASATNTNDQFAYS